MASSDNSHQVRVTGSVDLYNMTNQQSPAETLTLRIAETAKTFIATESFKHVQKTLDQYSHVTICGASGEGKTIIALMLARDYMKKGYEAVFVDKVNAFDFDEYISTTDRFVLIVDDMFGIVGLSSSITHLNSLINSIKTHIRDCSLEPKSKQSPANNPQNPTTKTPDIKVVITSNTCNFEDGISKLPHQRDSMFTGHTVVDLTADQDYHYSDREKIDIFEKFKTTHSTLRADELSDKVILNMDSSSLGFPLICRLYFELAAFRGIASDFFQRPMLYLRIELHDLLSLKNNQSAALILMLMCDDKLDLAKLEHPGRDEAVDEMVRHVTDILPSVTQQGIAAAVRHFRGTYFSGEDFLTFAHSSINDACACVMYNINPSFVLENCSLDFLYERLRPGPVEENSDDSQFLFVSDTDYPLIATRLVDAMTRGNFSKTVTHSLVTNERFVQVLFERLQSTPMAYMGDQHWLRQRDRGRGFLCWTVHGQCPKLLYEIENIANIIFTQLEITEALDACVENDNLTLLKALLVKLDKHENFSALNRLILLTGETGTWEIAQYLLMEGADVKTSDKNMQNYIHLACKSGRTNMIRTFISHIDSLVGRQDYLSAVTSVDVKGRTPAMVAASCGSWDCLRLLINDSPLDIEDCNGDSVIHSAAWSGNRDIVQHVLTPSNMNSKGMHGWTPVMNAAAHGHKAMFELLVSNNADLTLVDEYGDTLLHLACQGGDRDIVRHVLKNSDVNSKGKYGQTPVMKAAACGHLTVFEFLVSNNADLTLMDDHDDSLLHLASQGGNPDIVQHVLTPSNVNSKGMHGWTPLMKTVVFGHPGVFELLVSNNADLTLVDDYGDSLLHLACRGGVRDIVQHVLRPSNINNRGKHGWTPIMKAAYCGQQSVFELLVSNNADLSLVDKTGESLLHLACHGASKNIVQRVLTPSNIDSRGEDDWTPVMIAASEGQLRLLEFLLSKKADLTLLDVHGDNLLHVACRGGNRDVVQRLLTPANIDTRGEHGWTPLMIAAMDGILDVFVLLESNKADPTLVDVYDDNLLYLACRGKNINIVQRVLTPSNIDSRGEDGWTPVMIAAAEGQLRLFELLVSKKADLTLLDVHGDSVLHLASRGGIRDIVQHVLSPSNMNNRGRYGWTPIMLAAYCGQHSVFELLVSNNADLSLVDEAGESLLHLACHGGNKNIVQHVLTPSNIDSRGEDDRTPVMIAASEGHLYLFELLVSKKADLTLLDVHGDSLLHLACLGGNTNIVQHILTPFNIDSRGEDGWTPVMKAAHHGHRNILDLLVEHQADLTLIDEEGLDIVEIAQDGENTDVVDYLKTIIE